MGNFQIFNDEDHSNDNQRSTRGRDEQPQSQTDRQRGIEGDVSRSSGGPSGGGIVIWNDLATQQDCEKENNGVITTWNQPLRPSVHQ